MSPAAPIEPTKKVLPEPSSSGDLSPERADLENYRRFGDLRGVQWRIDLGILPSSSSSVDDFRRVTANCRRSYAALRRNLLINHHISKDENNFRDLVMDNPLSQNPDSMWGRFFHKAELEKMVDQDLSRLYPEHGSYFQTPGCQGVLRRILLLWCIRHPNYGYRQGMHELLAPLLYVLQADLERLSEVRKSYRDYFTDNFDGLSFNETDPSFKSDFEKNEDDIETPKNHIKANYLNALDPKIQTIISLSDAYGAEGELGIVLSEKFIEHDAYSMFDNLMSGNGGAVAMANFFSHSPSPNNGLPPVIEASSALYNLLSIVDLSLYSHLVELGVEPQYFALRWLRVLFGREFTLEGLLVIWDEIFSLDNNRFNEGQEKDENEVNFGVLKSTRGAFISALAVSMILYLRSPILATENATSCLQRLLNFPEDVNLGKLVKKAKSLMNCAPGRPGPGRPGHGHSLSIDLTAPGSPLGLVPESYWEEKWRVLNKEKDEQKQFGINKHVQNRIKGWSEKVKMRLSRTESAQFLSKVTRSKSPITTNLLNNNNINNNDDHENDTEKSSVASNSSVNGPGSGPNVVSPLPVSDRPEDLKNVEITGTPLTNLREGRLLSGKFQWLWMFSKNGSEGTSEKGGDASDPIRASVTEIDEEIEGPSSSSEIDEIGKLETVGQNNLKNLARSMLENIEVIESVFQQENVQTEPPVENSSKNAMESLKELRTISDLLSEM